MPRLLLFALLLLGGLYGVPALLAAFRELDDAKRRRLTRTVLGLLVAALVIFVLARFGLQWLGVVGTGVWVVLRTLAPWLLRLLPLGYRFREHRARAAGAAAHDRNPADDSRTDDAAHARARGSMGRPEALAVLGLGEGASRAEILHAYRNLVRKVHPDSPGGSAYLTTKLNQAKEVLLD